MGVATWMGVERLFSSEALLREISVCRRGTLPERGEERKNTVAREAGCPSELISVRRLTVVNAVLIDLRKAAEYLLRRVASMLLNFLAEHSTYISCMTSICQICGFYHQIERPSQPFLHQTPRVMSTFRNDDHIVHNSFSIRSCECSNRSECFFRSISQARLDNCVSG